MNLSGAIVGWEYTPLGGPNEAFRYSPVLNDVFEIGPNGAAYDINDDANVVGASAPPDGGNWTAAIWYSQSITNPFIVGSVPGYELSEFYDINNNPGVAVGRAYTAASVAEPSHAIYFDALTLYDLNDYLPPGT